jgi:hypothetical protein
MQLSLTEECLLKFCVWLTTVTFFNNYWNLFYHCCYTKCLWRNSPTRTMAASCSRFLDHTQWPTTVGRTPLDEGSARCRDLYLITHNTHKREASMPPARFFFCSLCTLSILLCTDCPGFLPFVLTVQHTQHKHPCPRRDSISAIPASGRSQTLAWDRSTTGIGYCT